MSQPITKLSVSGASTTGPGDDTRTLGHHHLTVFAALQNFDSANDTAEVVLEASPDRVRWDTVTTIQNADFSTDPDSGEDTASSFVTGEYYEYIRARVTDLSDAANADLTVDVYVMAGGNAGQGRKGTDRSGPVSNL